MDTLTAALALIGALVTIAAVGYGLLYGFGRLAQALYGPISGWIVRSEERATDRSTRQLAKHDARQARRSR
jgi:hypothetical protein